MYSAQDNVRKKFVPGPLSTPLTPLPGHSRVIYSLLIYLYVAHTAILLWYEYL